MNRFDRIVALLIQLQTRRVVSGPALAAQFGVSLRTIYRDIRTLELAGVPVFGEPNVGYSLAEGYRLPPVMFTREEAAALLTAEKHYRCYGQAARRAAPLRPRLPRHAYAAHSSS
jgi:predicted DNA-binding transcriptional regulator YafY